MLTKPYRAIVAVNYCICLVRIETHAFVIDVLQGHYIRSELKILEGRRLHPGEGGPKNRNVFRVFRPHFVGLL